MTSRLKTHRWQARRALAAFLCTLGGVAPCVFADSPSTPLALVPAAAAGNLATTGDSSAQASDIETLIQHIRQQEARLSQLEAELDQATNHGRTLAYHMLESDDDKGEGDDKGDGEAEADDEQDADALGKRFEAVDKQFKELQEQLGDFEDSLEKVDKLASDKSIVRSGSSKSTLSVNGRIHADAWGFDTRNDPVPTFMDGGDPQNRLGFRRIRFGVKGNVKDNMLYKIEMEFAGGADSQFRDVFIGWNDLPILQEVLLGNQKRPYGLDHLNSSRFNVFIERPFVIEGFNQDARRLGLASYGFSENLRWNWRYGVYNQRNVQELGSYVDDQLQLELAGRLANTIWYDETSDGRGYAHWGISGAHADSSTKVSANEARFRTRPEARSTARWLDTGAIANADFFNLLGLESVVNVGPVQFVGEYQSTWVGRNAGSPDVRFDGGYVYASYFLTGEHMPWDRESGTLDRITPFQNFWLVNRCDGCREGGWGAWQIAARYSRADFNDQDIFGGVGEAWTFGLNWYWNANARMQFNYINGEIRDTLAGPAAGLESGRYNIFGARFGIDF